eukprot:jgi/Ulvmu1/2435/UM134_0016.1
MPNLTALMSIGMLVTGALNTLSVKFQDTVVVGRTPDGAPLAFYHPAVQSACMFLGEFLCIIPYLIQRWRAWSGKRRQEAETANGSNHEASEPLLQVAHASHRDHPSASSFSYASVPAYGEGGGGDDISDSVFMLALPTLCDAASTTLMNVGLYYTSASTFQMLRGLVVFFAGLFTILILKRRLYVHHWQGMLLISVGAFIVGLSSLINANGCPSNHRLPPYIPPHKPPITDLSAWNDDPCLGDAACISESSHNSLDVPDSSHASGWCITDLLVMYIPQWVTRPLFDRVHGQADACSIGHEPLLGNVCVMAAQVFAALQYVVEEKYVKHYRVPASLAVGLEGFWGLILSCILLPLFQNLPGPMGRGSPVDDVRGAFEAIARIPALATAVAVAILSMGLFNWFGVNLTISLSGATRLSIDACRTLLVWAVSLLLGWERFNSFQLLGFLILVCGATLYNELMANLLEPPPRFRRTVSSRGLGPQYNRMTRRSPWMPAQPFEVSPALRIAGAGVRPHSLSSMGGFEVDSPGSGMWGVSLDNADATHGVLGTAAASASAPRGRSRSGGGDLAGVAAAAAAAAANSRRLTGVNEAGMRSFSKYKMYYSGFDTGVTPPMPVLGMARSSMGSTLSGAMSHTPRPGEFANTAGQEWDGRSMSVRSDSVRPMAQPPELQGGAGQSGAAPSGTGQSGAAPSGTGQSGAAPSGTGQRGTASQPSLALPLVTAADQRPEAGPSRSILSEQLSRSAAVRAVATGAAKDVPQPQPPARSQRSAPMHISASDPVLALQHQHPPAAAPNRPGDAGMARPALSLLTQAAAAAHDSPTTNPIPSIDMGSVGLGNESPDMSGEFNVR